MFTSRNPATGETGESYAELDAAAIDARLQKAARAYAAWRVSPLEERAALLTRIADRYTENREKLARMATFEMGKTLTSALAEVDKCANAFRFYAEKGAAMLADVETDLGGGRKAIARWSPQGAVLAVMPWNFPFWQVVRFLAPTIMAGNVGLLKHASNVPGCAQLIEDMVTQAGAPEGLFQNLHIKSDAVAGLIADERIVAVTLTGSEGAGMKVAEQAGQALKKVVLELGGSDPFIVMPSADLDKAAATAVKARIQNSGQSCICAKRMIVHADVHDAFMERFVKGMQAVKTGDPLAPETDMGPLSSHKARDEMTEQLKRAVAAGATLMFGGETPAGPGAYMLPAILTDIPRGAAVAREEFFGPVAMIFKADDIDHAIEIANDVPFGLGSSIWTNDPAERDRLVRDIEAGMVAVNEMLASDPHAPFGGIKRSGHGRELGRHGLHEFMNLKTVMLAG